MKYEYSKDFEITYTGLDSNANISLTSAISLAQNMVTEYFESFKSDNKTIKDKNNALWVLTKTKILFNSFPTWKDIVKAKSYTTQNSQIRSESEITFKDSKGELAFVAKQEYCIIDIDTRKIRKISSVSYPNDMEFEEGIYPEPYGKLKYEFEEKDFVYEQIVYSPDIDFSKHTNNVVYIRYLLNTLSLDFLNNHKIKEFEIHYINETREGAKLKIYKVVNNNEIEFLIKEEEKEIVRAVLKFEE